MPNWKKVIVSGSDAALNTLTVSNGITGSLFGTASWARNALSASYAPSSNAFPYIGDAQITGSLLVTGSVILSGSKTGGANPSIKIDGGVQLDGYLRFEPVDVDINTSISASYIYVSGSTRDLYFAQNGNGYNNVTRLRWLEGNLYTGLLEGGLITTQSSTVYQVSSGSGIIVSLNASLIDDPYPTTQYITWGNLSASIAPLTASYDQSFIAIEPTGSVGKIYVSGTPYSDGQYDTLIPIGNVIHQNRSTINATATYPSVAYGFKQRSNDFIKAFGPLKLSGLNTYVSGSSTGSLIVTSGTAYSDGRNYRTDPNNPSYVTDSGIAISKIYRYYQSGSGWVYDTNGGVGYGAIDPTQYSNNGVLTAVPGGGSNREWSIQRVYYFPAGATKGIYVYYGNATYATKVEAIANIPFEDFVEAPNTAAGAILSAYLIVRNNADFTDVDSYSIQQGGLFRNIGGAGGGGSVVTQTLAGLSDVAISGPTNGQPLVYNTTATKWQNQSTLTATLNGNATTATTAATASYVTGSIFTNNNSVASASYAATASLVNGNVKVAQATIGLATVPALYTTNKATVSTGTTTVHTVLLADYTSAFVDYTISDSTNARSGQIKVVWLNGQINYTDITTMDIGDTSVFDWDVVINGGNIEFNAVVTSSTWLAKLIVRTV
jgi:hypothetical protein